MLAVELLDSLKAGAGASLNRALKESFRAAMSVLSAKILVTVTGVCG